MARMLSHLTHLVQTECQWAADYVWYVEKVLVGEESALTEADHGRRRRIETTVPPARLAEWAELADDPHEAECLFAWLQGRLDFAEFMLESIDWRLGNTANEFGERNHESDD